MQIRETARGQSFLSDEEKTPRGEYKRHLRIIITDADEENRHVVVSVTTLKFPPKQDISCILKAGDHPFIKHKSIVDYKYTRIMSSMEIREGLRRGLLIKKEEVRCSVLVRIIEGAKHSIHIPSEIKNMIP